MDPYERAARPVHTLFQLSDLHIVPDGTSLYGVVDTAAQLTAALHRIETAEVDVAALILSGDLTDGGDLASYEQIRTIVEPAAARMGAPAVYVAGNHDSRGPLRAGLLGLDPSDQPYDQVHWTGDLRIVLLDTSVPGHAHGELSDAQLRWLADVLAERAPDGTVLVLHHPPVPSPVALMNSIGLRDPERLADLLPGTDVKIILSGHDHHASAGVVGGVPVWISGACSYSGDPLGPPGVYRGRTGGQFTRVDLYPDGAVATAIPIEPGDFIYDVALADL